MKRQVNQLKAGVVISYINLFASSIIPLLYTPIMLSLLGQAEYGLYSLSSSVISYLTLLTLGFGSTIVRYLSKYRAEGKRKEEEQIFGFFLVLYCGLAILVLLCAVFIANNVELIFQQGLSDAEIDKMQKLVLIMSVNTALSFPISVFSSVISSHEQFIFIKSLNLFSTAALPVANLIALYMGFASVGMAFAGTVMNVILLPVEAGYCLRKINIRPRFVRFPKEFIRELFGFSVYIFIGTIVDMLFWSTDKVILGMLTSSAVVAVYNVGGTFNNMVMQLSTSISSILIPRINGMVIEKNSEEKLTELFIHVGRVQYLIVALVIAGFTVYGQSFIHLWVGEAYKDAYWIAVLTMFPLCVPLIQNTGLNIIIAENKHKFRAIVYLAIAILNVISTYLVVPYLGAIGAALCSCISYLLGQGIIINIYYYKVIKIDIPRFWVNILRMSMIPVLMMVIGLLLNRAVAINSWGIFLAEVICFTMIYAFLMYKFSMNEYEKNIFRSPIKKLLQIISRTIKR